MDTPPSRCPVPGLQVHAAPGRETRGWGRKRDEQCPLLLWDSGLFFRKDISRDVFVA